MATYSALPATLNLVATVGNDFTLSLTVTENGSPWVATGATLATDIIDSSGTVVATDFTTAASTGSVTLSLTDTQTGTLGVGVYSYRLSVTKSSLTRDWIAGTLSIVEAGVGGSSTSSASLSISNSAVSLSLTSLVAPLAENISVADAGGSYAGTTVEAVLAEVGSLAIPLPAANGSDDTTAIQAILTAHAGKVIKGRPGEDYIISSPLTIYTGTTLDMTGCTVTLAAASNCNMVRNQSYSTGTRDTDITIIGGTWDRGTVGGSNNNNHSFFLRRLDRVRLIGVRYLSTSGSKYGIALGDVTNALVADYSFTCCSDAVHITGPADNVTVERLSGTAGDDVVGITTTDLASYDDVHGSVRNVTVRDVTAATTTRLVLVSGTANGTADGYSLTGVTVDNCRQTSSGGLVSTGCSAAAETGTVDRLTIRNSSGGQILLRHVSHGTISIENCDAAINPSVESTSCLIENLKVTGHRGSSGVTVNNSGLTIRNIEFADAKFNAKVFGLLAVAALDNVTIRNVHFTGSSADFVTLAASMTRLVVDGCHVNSAASRRVVLQTTGTLGSVHFANSYFTAADTSSGELFYTQGGTSDAIEVSNCRLSAMAGVARNVGSGSTINVHMSNVRLSGCNRVVQGSSGVTVNASNVTLTSQVNPPFFVSSSAALTIRGSGFSGLATTWVQRSTTEAIRVIAPDLPCDVSILALNNGDTCYNVTAASGVLPGAGLIVCDGTTWRQATIGAVKTGTATLVGGTVTVNDSAITTNSVIRLAYKTIGGTPGAVYVSARTASTSFVITSTSGTDTSVIQYDVITY